MVHEGKSLEFKAFYEEFFKRVPYMQWHDGINASVVNALQGEERDEAEQLLIESLMKGDMWPARGLEIMKSTRSLPCLKERLKVATGSEVVYIAEVIEGIEGRGEYIDVIIDRLLYAGFWSVRIDAAIALRKFKVQRVIDALYQGMLDDDSLVRHHSADSLLAIHGLKPEIADHGETFRLMCVKKEINGKSPREHYEDAVRLLRFELERGDTSLL